MKEDEKHGANIDRHDDLLHDLLRVSGGQDAVPDDVYHREDDQSFTAWIISKIDALGSLTKKIVLILVLIGLYNYIGAWTVISLAIGFGVSWLVWSFTDFGHYIYLLYLDLEEEGKRLGVIQVGHDDWVENWSKKNDLTPLVSNAGNTFYIAQKVDMDRKNFVGSHVHGFTPLLMTIELDKYREASRMINNMMDIYLRSKVDIRMASLDTSRKILDSFFKMLDVHLMGKEYEAHRTEDMAVKERWVEKDEVKA